MGKPIWEGHPGPMSLEEARDWGRKDMDWMLKDFERMKKYPGDMESDSRSLPDRRAEYLRVLLEATGGVPETKGERTDG